MYIPVTTFVLWKQFILIFTLLAYTKHNTFNSAVILYPPIKAVFLYDYVMYDGYALNFIK
jgi:hypothetical protein